MIKSVTQRTFPFLPGLVAGQASVENSHIILFLDAIASPSTYPCQSVGDSFRFGDSYRICELCELVVRMASLKRITNYIK